MRKLKYYPELNKVSGGITATILMLQLEYWFEKTAGDAFFKFLEPCDAGAYRAGDSWSEELGFSKGEFRTAFSKIGKVYKSKKEFNESFDKFDGKMYLSYFDRIKKLTFYMRNDDLVEDVLEEVQNVAGEGKQISRSRENESLLSVDYPTDSLPHKKSTVPYEEMVEVYHKTCEELPRVEKLSDRLKKNLTHIWKWVEGDMSRIRQLFEKVKESDFLSGRIAGKGFKASLEWIMQHDKFVAILAGKYAVNFEGSRLKDETREGKWGEIKKPAKNKRFTNMMTHNWDFNQLEALEQEYIEAQLGKEKNKKCNTKGGDGVSTYMRG